MSDRGCFDCDETMERLDSYVDRELNDFEMVEVRKHLEDCPPCEKHFQFNSRVKVLVHTKGCTEKAPPELLRKILGDLKQV
ncbi:MAG TPA: mycothiol system anti-sigma-R factor [Candidatus Dormibacteraeota bacterium]|jgi:mycothiol system anti-sigma-R factor|nr:mycothiol system anti-sigma-R factor [Candidatus Dormibacteraeota bacterium]